MKMRPGQFLKATNISQRQNLQFNQKEKLNGWFIYDLKDSEPWSVADPVEKPYKLGNLRDNKTKGKEMEDCEIDVGKISSNSNEFFINFLNPDVDAESSSLIQNSKQ